MEKTIDKHFLRNPERKDGNVIGSKTCKRGKAHVPDKKHKQGNHIFHAYEHICENTHTSAVPGHFIFLWNAEKHRYSF
jgi:hypothetical protein